MARLLDEIKHELSFIKSHSLQPKWYKVLKVVILAGFLAGYFILFGVQKTIIFCAVFFFLSFVVHMVYRLKTERWTRSWLDLVVVEEDGAVQPKSIGKFYYSAVILNAVIALVTSQILPD